MQRGQATRLIAALHAFKAGPTSIEEIVAAPVAPAMVVTPAPPAAELANKRRFAEVLDQADDHVYDELPPEKVTELRAEHVRITGGPPPEDSRPTSEQLSALVARLKAKRAPFVDFAVWGPFGRRQAKMLKYTAQVFIEGTLQTRQLRGPSGFDSWRSSWRVFRSAMLMAKAARPSTLDSYEDGVRQLCTLFPSGWGTVASSDETLRAEQWEIMLEQALADRPAAFDPDVPWDYVIANSAYGVPGALKAHWWETRVVLPLLQGAGRGQAASAAARLEDSTSDFPAAPVGARRRRPKTQRGQGQAATSSQPPQTAQAAGNPKVQFCWAWNRHAEGCPTPCPHGRTHRCEHCGGANHRGKDCYSQKGKGKGKGDKGKGSKPTL